MITLLRSLRVGLHVLFAFLLALGVGLFLWEDPARATTTPALPLTVALALVYVVGTVWEHSVSTPPRAVVWWWLAVVTLLWYALVAVSITFVWLLFPLVLLFLHLLPRTVGVVAAAVLWGIAAFVPAKLHPGEWTAGSAVGPLIGTVLAVAIYWTYTALHREAAHHRAVADDLRATQEELAASEHQAGRLEERERLSREIHDTVAQGLSSIQMLLHSADRDLEKLGLTAEQLAGPTRFIDLARTTARDNLSEARAMIAALTPASLQETSLEAALERMASGFAAAGELTIDVGVEGAVRQLPMRTEAALLRIAQGAVGNVAKHAAASRCRVTVTYEPDEVRLDVVDNGQGFDPAAVAERPAGLGHVGLDAMRQRAAEQGGVLEVEATPGYGTAVSVAIPLPEDVAGRTTLEPETSNEEGA